MSQIKLFSGMDFSGKSTIIKCINKNMPHIFKCREKFLTPIDTLQKMIDNNIWLPPREEFIPLLLELLKKDTSSFNDEGPVLQDTLWAIKFVAKLQINTEYNYQSEINSLMSYISRYPQVDSYYVTTTMDERVKRYNIRLSEGKRISKSDKLVFSESIFTEVEVQYKQTVFKLFPETKLIDTTFDPPETIVHHLLNDKAFISDL